MMLIKASSHPNMPFLPIFSSPSKYLTR